MAEDKKEEISAKIVHLFGPEANAHEGLRLVLAFLRIPDPAIRLALVQLVERIAPPAAD